MPDTEGKMSPEEQKKAIDWLNRKAPNMVCPACKHSSFASGALLYWRHGMLDIIKKESKS